MMLLFGSIAMNTIAFSFSFTPLKFQFQHKNKPAVRSRVRLHVHQNHCSQERSRMFMWNDYGHGYDSRSRPRSLSLATELQMVSSEIDIIKNDTIAGDSDVNTRIGGDDKVEVKLDPKDENEHDTVNIVLLAGFESFNKDLYQTAAASLPHTHTSTIDGGDSGTKERINLKVFADSEIRTGASIGVGGATEEDVTNPNLVRAMKEADIFIGSLIFDYEDVVAVEALLDYVKGPRLLFECATELMTYNRVGSFNMEVKEGEGPAGPPPAVKAVLSKFSSGKEEDKISGYLKLLKV